MSAAQLPGAELLRYNQMSMTDGGLVLPRSHGVLHERDKCLRERAISLPSGTLLTAYIVAAD